MDIEERTDRFVLSVDLPGRTTRDIDVTVRGPRVRLVAPPPTDAADRGVPVRRERRRDGFERTFRLPERVDESRVSATYFDGTLRVDLPKLRPGRSVDVA